MQRGGKSMAGLWRTITYIVSMVVVEVVIDT